MVSVLSLSFELVCEKYKYAKCVGRGKSFITILGSDCRPLAVLLITRV